MNFIYDFKRAEWTAAVIGIAMIVVGLLAGLAMASRVQ